VLELLRSARGSAAVDFLLVGTLVTAMFLGLLQLGFDLHVRNVLAAAAADGARFGANADATPQDGADLANSLIRHALGPRYAQAVVVSGQAIDGAQLVTIRVTTQLPLLAGFLPALQISVVGRALAESR